MPQPIYYCVTVDTEEEWDWSSGYPTATPSVRNIQELPAFQSVLNEHSAAVTYFTNHAVLANGDAAHIMQELAKQKLVELGLHIHPWNTPPLAPVPAVPNEETYLHRLPWDTVVAKLETVLQSFKTWGFTPTSFRGGRYSTSPQIQNFLRDRGVRADCSPLPYKRFPDPFAPDHTNATIYPKRLPPRSANDRALWELPLSTGFSRKNFALWNNVMKFAQNPVGRALRFGGILSRLGIVTADWLNLEQPRDRPITRFLETLEQVAPPFVCLTMHSSSLLVGGSPYGKSADHVRSIMNVTREALSWLKNNSKFQAATMTEIADQLEARHTPT